MIEVILKLDKSSRARLSWIQSFAASFGIVPKPIYGHISVGHIENEQIASCKAALCEQEAFSVDFTAIDMLPDAPVVAALAAHNELLDAIHEKVSADPVWIPCVELLRDSVMNLSWVRKAMGEMFSPFSGKVERIEFLEGKAVLDAIDLK